MEAEGLQLPRLPAPAKFKSKPLQQPCLQPAQTSALHPALLLPSPALPLTSASAPPGQ